jgi:hypothetical protein
MQEVRKVVLPVLAKLLGEPGAREEAPHLLAALVAGSGPLQAAAADADAVAKLARALLHDVCTPRQLVRGCGCYCGRMRRLLSPALHAPIAI